jgi:hypothetical protein
MKSKLIHAAFALLSFGTTSSFAEPKGEAVTMKGEVIDVWCYLEGDDKGADHKKCAVACAKAGNPIGLLTEKGDVYVLVGIKDHDADRDTLIKKMAENVSVDGTLVKKGGTQVIYVSALK